MDSGDYFIDFQHFYTNQMLPTLKQLERTFSSKN